MKLTDYNNSYTHILHSAVINLNINYTFMFRVSVLILISVSYYWWLFGSYKKISIFYTEGWRDTPPAYNVHINLWIQYKFKWTYVFVIDEYLL